MNFLNQEGGAQELLSIKKHYQALSRVCENCAKTFSFSGGNQEQHLKLTMSSGMLTCMQGCDVCLLVQMLTYILSLSFCNVFPHLVYNMQCIDSEKCKFIVMI